jgi:hypothetical protein
MPRNAGLTCSGILVSHVSERWTRMGRNIQHRHRAVRPSFKLCPWHHPARCRELPVRWSCIDRLAGRCGGLTIHSSRRHDEARLDSGVRLRNHASRRQRSSPTAVIGPLAFLVAAALLHQSTLSFAPLLCALALGITMVAYPVPAWLDLQFEQSHELRELKLPRAAGGQEAIF